MLQLILVPAVTALLIIGLAMFVISLVKRNAPSSDERLDKEFAYRKEPHADQTTEHPNRLSGNDVTRG